MDFAVVPFTSLLGGDQLPTNWLSPAQSFLVSNPIKFYAHVFNLSGLLRYFEMRPLIRREKHLTATVYSPAAGH
jgi:hypothetical protein